MNKKSEQDRYISYVKEGKKTAVEPLTEHCMLPSRIEVWAGGLQPVHSPRSERRDLDIWSKHFHV